MRFSITLGCVLVLQLAACGGGDASAQLTFSPSAPPPPSGMTGVAYPAFTFAAPTGGIGPFTWSETGAFPSGLSLSPAGQLYGTPLTAGTFSFTLTVMDSSNPHQATTESVTLLVEDSPIVIDSTSAPPTGTQGVPYVGFAFTASGGSVPVTWRVTQGALPSGLTLNSDGTLSGTPLTTGSATFTVTARDGAPAPQAASGSFTLVVNPSAFALKNLVAAAAGTTASTVDPNLVDPWGLVLAPGSAGAVANNGTSTSTQYDGRGVPQPAGSPLVVRLPSGPAGTPFQPTGVVANATPDFIVGSGATAGAAQLIYAGASGLIAAWSPALGSSATITYTDTAGAVYTGLALASNGSGNFLYAADFYGRKIDVFDSAFQKQAPSAASFSFRDPFLPAAYAPFGIQAINNGSGGAAQLYISYAQPQGTGGTPITGQGLGVVNVFNANGVLVRRLFLGGPLNAPWGLALAPTDFGTLSAPLLVGNLGDGKINAFDPVSGRFRGTLSDVKHNALSVPGLRGIAFGNDFAHQGHNALFFTAGPGDSSGGVYGRIDAAYLLEILSIQFNACDLPGCNPTTQVAISPSVSHQQPIAEMQFFINGTLYRTVTQDPFEVPWTSEANAEVRVDVIDVAGDVATSCQRFAATSPCGG